MSDNKSLKETVSTTKPVEIKPQTEHIDSYKGGNNLPTFQNPPPPPPKEKK